MAVSCRGRSDTFWTLEPSHGHRVERMKVSEDFSFGSPSPKNNDFGASENCRMCVSWSGRSSGYFGFRELISVDIENVGIVEISVSFGFACEIMSSKDDDGSS